MDKIINYLFNFVLILFMVFVSILMLKIIKEIVIDEVRDFNRGDVSYGLDSDLLDVGYVRSPILEYLVASSTAANYDESSNCLTLGSANKYYADCVNLNSPEQDWKPLIDSAKANKNK